jgi:hypothetical protein
LAIIGALKEDYSPMTHLAINRLEMPALLIHAAVCVTLAAALGFIAAGLIGLDLKGFVALSKIAHTALALICITACFAIVWCSPEGPDRWRPFIVSREAGESIFGGAASLIVLGGIAAAMAFFLR